VRYKTRDKTVEIEGANTKGEVVGPISFKTGSYFTTDPDEIALLDALATDPANPVGFDPKESE
jgi:hypothetical protein